MIRIRHDTLRQRVFHRLTPGGVRPGLEGASSSLAHWWEVNPVCWGRLSVMNDLGAAIGLVQLRRVNSFLNRRRQIVHTYDSAFAEIPWLRLKKALPISTGFKPQSKSETSLHTICASEVSTQPFATGRYIGHRSTLTLDHIREPITQQTRRCCSQYTKIFLTRMSTGL
jgi:hypothetical protein